MLVRKIESKIGNRESIGDRAAEDGRCRPYLHTATNRPYSKKPPFIGGFRLFYARPIFGLNRSPYFDGGGDGSRNSVQDTDDTKQDCHIAKYTQKHRFAMSAAALSYER